MVDMAMFFPGPWSLVQIPLLPISILSAQSSAVGIQDKNNCHGFAPGHAR